MTPKLSRAQILRFRRRVSGLDERRPLSPAALEFAAHAGLQDSMPRAAVLSLHARLEGVPVDVLDDPTLVQVWGPRFSAYVVAERDRAVFTLGRYPMDDRGRRRAEEMAERAAAALGDRSMSYGEVGRAVGIGPNMLRYGTTTGRLIIEWDGARQPTLRVTPPLDIDPAHARAELARRHLHVCGPATAASLAAWAGLKTAHAAQAMDLVAAETTTVQTPIGERLALTGDLESLAAPAGAEAPARLLPSGDVYTLLHDDADRSLLVPDADRRRLLWTPRVWPGAVLVRGAIVGTWRRSKTKVIVQPWTKLSKTARRAIEAEAATMPLPDEGAITVDWE